MYLCVINSIIREGSFIGYEGNTYFECDAEIVTYQTDEKLSKAKIYFLIHPNKIYFDKFQPGLKCFLMLNSDSGNDNGYRAYHYDHDQFLHNECYFNNNDKTWRSFTNDSIVSLPQEIHKKAEKTSFLYGLPTSSIDVEEIHKNREWE